MGNSKILPARFTRLVIILFFLAGLSVPAGKGSLFTAARAADEPFPYRNYLPLSYYINPQPTLFGITMDVFSKASGFYQVVTTNTTWTRRDISWKSIESVEGERNWGAVQSLESDLILARQYRINVILVVGDTPAWALESGYTNCGPVTQAKFTAFGNFMRDLVARYNAAPFNLSYWELWNEPDVSNGLGCWGQPGDPYFGGMKYGQMLKAVYPVLKAADPSTQVLVGGLLLDCDPNNPPLDGSGSGTKKDCTPARFLEGILANGSASFFDGVSFHAYDYYLTESGGGMYANGNWHSSWNTTGPVASAKVDYIRSLLSQYGASNKYIMNTELALLCDICSVGSPYEADFERTKASYLAESYAVSIHRGLKASIWYKNLGWRNSGLFRNGPTPLPAFQAYKTAGQSLSWASSLGKISAADVGGEAGVTGYKFRSYSQKEIWILWSLDGAGHLVTLAGSPALAWTATGQAVLASNPLQITIDPIYLQMDP